MKRAAVALALVAAVAGLSDAQDKKKKVVLPPDSVYNIPTKTLEGQPADLKEQAGKVALIVNLASQ